MRRLPWVVVSFSVIAISLGGCVTLKKNGLALSPKPSWQTAASDCVWRWREGDGLGLWAETCRLNGKVWQVIFDPGLASFVTRRDDETVGIAVQRFTLPAGSGIAALGQTLIENGQLADDAACEWASIALRPAPRTQAFFVLRPKDPAAISPTALGEVPDPICGPYGASTHGLRYFVTDLRWPDVAIFVEQGQERPLFEPASITPLRP